MGDLSDFQRRQIVGAGLTEASANKRAILLGVSSAAVSKVITAYTNHGNTSPANSNSDRIPQRSERDRCTLEADLWLFGQHYLGMMLVELQPVITWTF
jgi:hypothetical protein